MNLSARDEAAIVDLHEALPEVKDLADLRPIQQGRHTR